MEANATHTPGPWRYSDDRIGIESETAWSMEPDPATGEEGSRVEVIHTQGAMGGSVQADIRLICAAPALLSALLEVKRLRDLWRSQDDAVAIDSIAYMDGLDRIDVDGLLARVGAE